MVRSLIILFTCSVLFAQDVSFDVSPREVGINQFVQFSIIIKGQDTGRAPTFKPGLQTGEFELASSTPSVQTQMSIYNGQASSSKTYTYLLRPLKKGKLTLPSQTIVYDGKQYKTQPIEVQVGDEVRSVQRTRRAPFEEMFQRRPRAQAEVFGTVELPKRDYWMGEPIQMTTYIYLTPGLYILPDSTADHPDLTDFWVEDALEQPEEPVQSTRDGKTYARYTVGRKRLFARKTGDLVIPAAVFDLAISDMPMRTFSSSRVRRTSQPVTVKIKALPSAGKPRDFSGLVGRFNIRAELDKDAIKVGETANLKLTLSGNGNFNAVAELSLPDLDPSFEVFKGGAPETKQSKGVVTSKTWTLALVPKREGNFTLNMPSVPFFDLRSETYQTATTESFQLTVAAGEGLGSGAIIGGNAGPRQLVAEENLAFIKIDPMTEQAAKPVLSRPLNLVFLIVGLLIVDLLVFLFLTVREQVQSRRAGRRPAYALRNFKRALARLKAVETHSDSFHGGLSEAVLNYFGDKWEREGKGISLDTIREKFDRGGLPAELYEKVAEVVEACDLARFTPSSPSSRENLVNKARTVLEGIEGALK